MGFFTHSQKETADDVYDNMKDYLAKKDGFIHVIMIDSFSKTSNKSFECEDKYTSQLDKIIINMQKSGYEIVNIKFNVLMNQGFFKKMEGFYTLIMYK